jgi:NAD+--dinitrogen-reductase ADP-D-ribosyltransferase
MPDTPRPPAQRALAAADASDADDPGAHPQPRTWYATNLVGTPAWVLASADFNAHPHPLHVVGTREAHAGLFHLLQTSRDQHEAAEVFMHYMSLAFGLQPEPSASGSEARRWRASYIKLLQGWGGDSNGPAGAVLKGWVESRFGIVPCYHKGLLGRFPSPAWVAYMEEKATSRFHNNCIHQQLDLLFEFGQWAIRRFQPFGASQAVDLWRGVQRVGDHEALPVESKGEGEGTGRVLRFNNLLSFATAPADAQCFGDTLLKVRVPLCKLLFFPGLLPKVPLSGEGEVLAIGGDMAVEVCRD